MYYSKSEQKFNEKSHIRCISLIASQCQIQVSLSKFINFQDVKDKIFSIKMDGIKQPLKLKAETVKEAKDWVAFFNNLFEGIDHNNHENSKFIVEHRDKIVKGDLILEEEFMKEANTGDILLFRTKGRKAALQRTLLRSDYDHIALILKLDNEITIFEAAESRVDSI
jgi:hypothetical protein